MIFEIIRILFLLLPNFLPESQGTHSLAGSDLNNHSSPLEDVNFRVAADSRKNRQILGVIREMAAHMPTVG